MSKLKSRKQTKRHIVNQLLYLEITVCFQPCTIFRKLYMPGSQKFHKNWQLMISDAIFVKFYSTAVWKFSVKQQKKITTTNNKQCSLLLFVCIADKSDEDDSLSAMYQAVSELPNPNRDTLAFLIVHLQRFVYFFFCFFHVSFMCHSLFSSL